MEQKKNNLPLKYKGYAIALQEVPDEISLAFNISGCTHKCPGCHSEYLWNYDGRYLGEDLLKVLSINKEFISCVCFMGGDQNIEELYDLCKQVKDNGLKVCIYSGIDNIEVFSQFICDSIIDYLKIGSYQEELGGLNNVNTNQRMYKIIGTKALDITHTFQKPKI